MWLHSFQFGALGSFITPVYIYHSKKKLVNLTEILVTVVANRSICAKLCSVACPTRE